MADDTSNAHARVSEHLSNERTFLSWLRTSIGIMAFGFVIERFALLMKQLLLVIGRENGAKYFEASIFQSRSLVFGQVFIALGLLVCIIGLISYNKARRQIDQNMYRPAVFPITFIAFTIIFIGFGLVFYLNQATFLN